MSQLYLFPNLLADLATHQSYLPESVDSAVATITHLIAENEKEGRRFLRRFAYPAPKTFRDISIHLLSEHTTEKEKRELIDEISKGGIWGLVSDCGMPCLADPGADLVLMARQRNIKIETFAGPSSILFALVLSGLGGQHFTFHGYLPREEPLLLQALKKIERTSQQEKSTHLFIETPYRNQRLFQALLTLQEGTWVSIACDLTLETQHVETKKVKEWRKTPLPTLDKRPCVFAIRGY